MSTQPKQPAKNTNILARFSFIFGILGVLLSVLGLYPLIALQTTPSYFDIEGYWLWCLCGLGSYSSVFIVGVLGLITGTIAFLQIMKKVENRIAKVIAIMGITLGILNCIISISAYFISQSFPIFS